MCLKNMENSDKSPKNFDKNILELFWTLTDKNPERRIDTCLSIIRSLCKKQSEVKQTDDLSKDLKYCVERLVKGLSSPRDNARLGFALLLTEILKQFTVLEIEDVLEHIKQHLAFTLKQEKRDIVFGQLFAYSAIIRSGRLANHSQLSLVTLAVYDLWQGRSYILNGCYEIVKDLLAQLSPEKFAEDLWPQLKSKFSNGWEKSSPDSLWFLLLCIRLFPGAIGEKFLRKHFSSTNMFAAENFDQLKKLIRQTTSCLPNIHPFCSEVSIICSNLKDIKEVWNFLVDDNLFEGEQTEKSFVGFEMVKCALQTTKKKKVIKCILSPKLRFLFARSFINSKSPMNPASTQLADYLSKYAIVNNTPDIQMIILKFFLEPPGTMSLDQILKKKEVSVLIQNLLPDTIKVYCEFLKAIALKIKTDKGDDSETPISETRRFVAIAQMANLVSHIKIVTDIEWRISVIKFLFLHSFFSIKEGTSEILHCENKVEEISASLRESCKNAFFKTLTSLYQRVDQQTPLQHSLQCLTLLLEYADQLMSATENIEPHFDLEKVQESWLQMKSIVHKLKKQTKKDGKVNESNAFLALFLELGFHLFHDYEHISEVLEELHICCIKALSDRKHATEEADDMKEPPWVSVVTDIMLSLLSRSSHHIRRLVISVFQLLCPFITQDALQQILAVINPEKDSEDPMLVDESDDEADLNFESGSSSDESDSNIPEDSTSDEKFKKKVKEALGSAADASDAESVVLSDSEMFKLDDALSNAFRERVQTGPNQMKSEDKTMLEFRIKCLDLIMTYLKSDPPMYLVLHCIDPILAAYEFSHRNELQKHLMYKIVSTIEIIPKIKKFQHLDNVNKSELKNLLKRLITKCHKEVNLDVAKKLYSLCVFVVLCFRRLESQKSEKKTTKNPSYMKMYLSALKEFATGSSSHIYPQFFVTMMESCPDLAWNLIELCQNYAFDSNIRMYRKTQCLGLLFEAIKFAKRQDTISDNEWIDLSKTLIPVAIEALKRTLQDAEIKPVYVTELLDVIYVCHTSFKEKTNQSILDGYSDLVSYLSDLPIQEKKRLGKKGKSMWKKIVRSLGGTNKVKKDNKIAQEEKIELSDSIENPIDTPTKKRKSTSKDNVENSIDITLKKRKSISKESKKKKQKAEENIENHV